MWPSRIDDQDPVGELGAEVVGAALQPLGEARGRRARVSQPSSTPLVGDHRDARSGLDVVVPPTDRRPDPEAGSDLQVGRVADRLRARGCTAVVCWWVVVVSSERVV